MIRRLARSRLQHTAVVATALACVAARVFPQREAFGLSRGPAATARAAASLLPAAPTTAYLSAAAARASAGRPIGGADAADVSAALSALAGEVRTLSHPLALEDAFRSYYAYRAAHADEAPDNPYLYFVDYGLPSSAPRGYVFDMQARRVLEGPFPVAHGRGSGSRQDGVPRRFANLFGAATTSLGLYVAQELYAFRGHANGRAYASTGLRLSGVSGAFNSLARARGVVAHGAPYVTPSGAGRSEGCPAMEPGRADRLLPKLAHGGLVFLFAPDARWMAADPWLAASDAVVDSAAG